MSALATPQPDKVELRTTALSLLDVVTNPHKLVDARYGAEKELIRVIHLLAEGATPQPAHTDHGKHWDRTCPACNASVDYSVQVPKHEPVDPLPHDDQRVAWVLREAASCGIRVTRAEMVGSTYICGAEDRDVDVLMLAPDEDIEAILMPGWAYGGSAGEGNDHFASFKQTVDGVEYNALFVKKPDYFVAWLTAAEVCRFLHRVEPGTDARDIRVGIHNIIMDDSDSEFELMRASAELA